jgi:hypothetical protein
MWLFTLFSAPRSVDAEAELRAELREFAFDGLTQLHDDLSTHAVKRGTWDGCVLSYRLGGPGSVSCDRKGRRGNAFTRYWDTERVPTDTVLRMIQEEIETRGSNEAPAGKPAIATSDRSVI